jgi:hypothetical protein
VEVEIDALGVIFGQNATKFWRERPRRFDGSGHHHIELSAHCGLEHAVKTRALFLVFGPEIPSPA